VNIIKIEAVDAPDAWFQVISSLINSGDKYKIEHGSYVGQTRIQHDYLILDIKKVYSEPYDSMLPQIPAHLNIPNPVANGFLEQYAPYLLTDHIEPNEQYTYGSRMFDQIPYWTEVLKKTPNTNQAILQVAQPEDYLLEDPPCLRSIKLKIKDGKLIFYPYFRSWDAWGGMSSNLGGLAVLQKMMSDDIGVECGGMVATSDGVHIYQYVEELSKIRCGKYENVM